MKRVVRLSAACCLSLSLVIVPNEAWADGLPTTDGQFSGVGPIGTGGVLNLTVAGRGGVPASGVDAVAVNVTATGSTAESYLTVWPAGTGRPTASNLNFTVGQTTPNMVIAKVGTNGQISIFNNAGNVDVIVDVLGWFPTGGSYTGLSPARLLDSRTTPPPAPPTPPTVLTFQPGTLIVNTTIPPGRYIAANAISGCNWERVSGFGGTLDEILANDFQTFTGPILVDILATDVGFTFKSKCGSLKTYTAPPGPTTTIAPGAYVIGADVVAGTYTASAQSGCYWERLKGFSGSLSDIIANDFVASAGQLVVTISATDVGFHTDADCGTWTRS